MKILVLMYNAATKGGLQYPTRTLLEYLAQRGHEVHLVSNTVPADWSGVQVHAIPFALTGVGKRFDYILNGLARRVPSSRLRNSLKPAGFIAECQFPIAAAQYCLDHALTSDCDVTIVPQHFCCDGAQLLWKKQRVPFVAMGHGHVFDYPWQTFGLLRYLHFKRATRDAYRQAQSVIVVGRRMLKQVIQYRKSDTGVYHIPNGVNLDQFHAAPSKAAKAALPTQILFVGRMEYEKGIQYLLPALSGLSDLDFQCTLIGTGSQIGRFQSQANQLGLAERCKFVGAVPREQVAMCYQQAHLLVMPSLAEGHPSVLIESMASGVPVVGTRIVGIEDVIVPGKNGLLVPPRNSQELAKAIRKLMDSPELRDQFAKNGLHTVKEYEWQKILPRLEKAILETVEHAASEKQEAARSPT